MTKIALLLGISTVIVGGAFAQTHKLAKAPTTIHCAVMGSEVVNIAKATKSHSYADYKGRRYFFCCEGCPASFKKDPAKYAKSPSIATPKTPKKVAK